MLRWLIGLVLNALVLMGIAYLFSGFEIAGFGTAILASLLLSIVNMIVRPILVVFTFPITILTLGLFLFVISALTLMLTAWMMGDSFVIDGFFTAVLAAILIALAQTFVIKPLKKKK
ncbi:phage holin family protein [Halalkalibacter hemicellulosilyticus]|uniref:Phage holin family protein n=1 Tax=Halalkalibacter hemicellulosilyticusJCM 9152 TaxID=1236971 RepID=W4QHL8_9BACI|nr:phage holin family protein [Halalkalibacter hemicellulosilyticus]GAE31581.1 hypothetical protein JCM9152_3058 [Halalkalibacter hemicellulosilyticusJCM 9152]